MSNFSKIILDNISKVFIGKENEILDIIKGILANVILADEINRSTAKTQSALLQVMEEGEITEANITYKLSKPVVVLATENPVEQQGVYNLPEAQLDRFILKVHLGYPETDDEIKILQGKNMGVSVEDIKPVVSKEEVIEMQNKLKDVHVSPEIQKYIIRIVQSTRNSKKVILEVSTRGAIALMKIAQAEALLDDRDYVIPEDVKKNAKIVLGHRIIKQNIKLSEDKIIEEIISKVPVVI